MKPFSRLALGIKIDTLGAGVELATPLSRSFNLRASGNFADIGYGVNVDGIDYFTRVNFRSGQIGIDWFPFHGSFHLSPGLLYFKNALSGVARVLPGHAFELDSNSYMNSVDDPVSGTASVTYSRHVAPSLTAGFGNIIPRTGHHLTLPFEFGVAYLGAAYMDLRLAGTACTYQGCANAATDVNTQSDLQNEIRDLNEEVRKYKLFPIVSLGVAYRF